MQDINVQKLYDIQETTKQNSQWPGLGQLEPLTEVVLDFNAKNKINIHMSVLKSGRKKDKKKKRKDGRKKDKEGEK